MRNAGGGSIAPTCLAPGDELLVTSEALFSAGSLQGYSCATGGEGMARAARPSFSKVVVGFVSSVFSMFSNSQPTGLPAGTHSSGFRHHWLSPLPPCFVPWQGHWGLFEEKQCRKLKSRPTTKR